MFYSQDKQDQFLETYVFRGFKNGFFVDVGAHDGVSFNNTLYFEKENQWNGINIEPIQRIYDKLVENRPNCININCAICNEEGTAEFLCNTGYTEMISGLKNFYHPKHSERLAAETKQTGSTTEIIQVATHRLESILEKQNVKRIHYLSIDVEGAEFEVIKSINFDKVFIDVIGFENGYDDKSVPIIDYLEKKGFTMIFRAMDIFMMNKQSPFLLNFMMSRQQGPKSPHSS